jgi:PadR family transcriptional regulator
MNRGSMKREKADLFKQGTLELLLLRLLSSGSLNGWDIMQRLQIVSGEVLTVTAGALYPALHRLEARGLISAVWRPSENNRRAKFYGLTTRGRKQLETQRKEWERFSDAVALILRSA